jgi:hypothetical protein
MYTEMVKKKTISMITEGAMDIPMDTDMIIVTVKAARAAEDVLTRRRKPLL